MSPRPRRGRAPRTPPPKGPDDEPLDARTIAARVLKDAQTYYSAKRMAKRPWDLGRETNRGDIALTKQLKHGMMGRMDPTMKKAMKTKTTMAS